MRQCTHTTRHAQRAALAVLTLGLIAGCASDTLTKEERAQREALVDQLDAGESQTSNRDRRLRTR